MRFVYLGTDWFSAEVLKRISGVYKPPELVITQKPKPRGRGLKILPVPVREEAEKLGLNIFEIESFKELEGKKEELKDFEGLVVCSFGLYIPSWFTEIFEKGSFNFHPSLVPRYRGAAPVQRALLNGDERTGVSIIEVAPEMDAGKVYGTVEVPILLDDDYETLSYKLINAGVPLLAEILKKVDKGEVELKEQEGEVIYAPKISKEELFIDWRLSALEIHNKVRALSPKPGARSYFREKLIKILKTVPDIEDDTSFEPGVIAEVSEEFLTVQTGKGRLKIFTVQPENKRVMSARDFLNGYRVKAGERFLDSGKV